jgi:hypothetical protein
MKFAPKTEDEIRKEQEKRGAWPPGIYDAEIVSAVEKLSKAGNDMIEMTLQVYHPDDGTTRQVYDWLLEAMAYKLRHCCEAVGLSDAYDSGSLEAWQLEGKSVRVKLGIDAKAEIKRNKVMDYVVEEPAAPARAPVQRAASASKPADPFGDDIPF